MNPIYQKGNEKIIRRTVSTIKQEGPVKTNLPNLPLLGQLSTSDLIQKLSITIQDETNAVDFYTRLLSMAPNELHKEFVADALEEEKNHLATFKKVYAFLTGETLSPQVVPVKFANYKEGVLHALKDELDAADFYKHMILSVTDPMIKDAYFYAMGDELEHSSRFSTLYNLLP
jgi:rubrerythrin